MSQKTKKAQVVVAALDAASQSIQILLLQTNEKRGGFWQNVTGKIEGDETFEEGALREAIEETQLQLESIVDLQDLNLDFEFTDARKRNVHEKCFLIVLDQVWNVVIDPHEHQAFKWVPVQEISPSSVKFPSNYDCLVKARKLLHSWSP